MTQNRKVRTRTICLNSILVDRHSREGLLSPVSTKMTSGHLPKPSVNFRISISLGFMLKRKKRVFKVSKIFIKDDLSIESKNEF